MNIVQQLDAVTLEPNELYETVRWHFVAHLLESIHTDIEELLKYYPDGLPGDQIQTLGHNWASVLTQFQRENFCYHLGLVLAERTRLTDTDSEVYWYDSQDVGFDRNCPRGVARTVSDICADRLAHMYGIMIHSLSRDTDQLVELEVRHHLLRSTLNSVIDLEPTSYEEEECTAMFESSNLFELAYEQGYSVPELEQKREVLLSEIAQKRYESLPRSVPLKQFAYWFSGLDSFEQSLVSDFCSISCIQASDRTLETIARTKPLFFRSVRDIAQATCTKVQLTNESIGYTQVISEEQVLTFCEADHYFDQL